MAHRQEVGDEVRPLLMLLLPMAIGTPSAAFTARLERRIPRTPAQWRGDRSAALRMVVPGMVGRFMVFMASMAWRGIRLSSTAQPAALHLASGLASGLALALGSVLVLG